MTNPSSIDNSTKPTVEKPIAPVWMFKVINPFMRAILRSKAHKLLSGTLMLITYKGRKTGKSYTNPIGYYEWSTEELISFTSASWWKNVLNGSPVSLLVKGRKLQALPKVIREKEEIAKTGEEFIKRLGMKPVIKLMLGLPGDREPTPADFDSIPAGRTIIIFKIIKK
jgi:hypothetical protein